MSGRPTTVICEWCNKPFPVLARKGPVPKFCSGAHRQRAFEQRRLMRALRAGGVMGADEPVDTMSVLVGAAVQMHELFLSLMQAGFTERQAIMLCAEMVRQQVPPTEPEGGG